MLLCNRSDFVYGAYHTTNSVVVSTANAVKMKNVLDRILEVKGDRSTSSFARALGMRQQTIDGYLRGQRKLSVEFVNRICCSFGVSADWLLGFTDDRAGHSAPAVDSVAARRVADLEAEVGRLRAANDALLQAFSNVGKGAHGVSVPRSARATGA